MDQTHIILLTKLHFIIFMLKIFMEFHGICLFLGHLSGCMLYFDG